MTSNSTIVYATGLALSAAWACILFQYNSGSDLINLIIFSALLGITSYVLSRSSPTLIPIPIKLIATILAPLAIWCFWWILKTELFLPSFIPRTKMVVRSWFFLSGPLIAIVIALTTAYPLTALFKRYWFIPPFLAAAVAICLELPMWLNPESTAIVKAISAVANFAFLILPPLVIYILARACGWIANNSFKPNPLRSFKTPPGSSGGSA